MKKIVLVIAFLAYLPVALVWALIVTPVNTWRAVLWGFNKAQKLADEDKYA